MRAWVKGLRGRLANWHGDQRGTILVEFAISVPVLLTLYIGGYVLSDEMAASRKVTVTARAITDLITRYGGLSPETTRTVLGASAQILVPYQNSSPRTRVSEVLVTSANKAQVIWSIVPTSQASDSLMPALDACTQITLPTTMAAVNTYLILGEVQLTYQPVIGFGTNNPITMRDRSFMSPRNVTAIPMSGVTIPTCS